MIKESTFRTTSKKDLGIPQPISQYRECSKYSSLASQLIPGTTSDHRILVVSNFSFKGENKHELSVEKGEKLMLIKRVCKGWILVEPVERLGDPGLVPASYVSIFDMKGSHNTNIDEKWLALPENQEQKETTSPFSTCHEEDIKPQTLTIKLESKVLSPTSKDYINRLGRAPYSFSSNTKAPSISSSLDSWTGSKNDQNFSFESDSKVSSPISSFSFDDSLPVFALVKNASCHHKRYWYRVDISMSDGRKRYLCRYYQDFYKLHCDIIEELRASGETEENIQKLPTLPDPIARSDLQTSSTVLLRCQKLNTYIFKIVQNKDKLNYLKILKEWIQQRLGDIESLANETLSNEEIERSLRPLSTKPAKSPTLDSNTSFDSSKPAAILDPPIPEQAGFPVPIQQHTSKKSPMEVIEKEGSQTRTKLSISTSVTPPLPALSTFRSNSNPSLSPISSPSTSYWSRSSPVLSPRANITPGLPYRNIPSPKQSQNPFQQHQNQQIPPRHPKRQNCTDLSLRSNKGGSAETLCHSDISYQACQDPHGSLEIKIRDRNQSAPTILSDQSRSSSEFVKMKIFAKDDIFALKVKNDVTLEEIKQQILSRLECDPSCTMIKLHYKNQTTGHYVAWVSDSQLEIVLRQSKICIKVHQVTGDSGMI